MESYDRNQNFGRPEDTPKEFTMDLPDISKYKDIHNGTKLVDVTLTLVTTYLNLFDKKLENSAIQLYKERYLLYVRSTEMASYQHIKSVCRAEMKRSVTYNLDISFTDGTVHEAQCECAAGMGPQAHCKHICALLYGMVEFTETGTIRVEETCTEKLQTFHKAKKLKGSPMKAKDLNMPGADQVSSAGYDPRPVQCRNLEGYPSYFRSICMNFRGISTMPIFQIFEPANAFAQAHDHDYERFTPEMMFLNSMRVESITETEIISIEVQTRGQSSNPKWTDERSKRLTSSNFGRIVKATVKTDFDKLASDLINTKHINTEAINHGRKYERCAIERYNIDHDVTVQDCGIFVSKDHPYIAASPDGIVDSDVLCEVKCPFKARNSDINSQNVPYLLFTDGCCSLDKKHNYYYQVQGQLLCANRKFCDFIVYTISDVKYIRIVRDEQFIKDMLVSLKKFYDNYFKNAVLKKFFYKPY